MHSIFPTTHRLLYAYSRRHQIYQLQCRRLCNAQLGDRLVQRFATDCDRQRRRLSQQRGYRTTEYPVTGTVSGWTAGENFTITLNGANATVISANGAFSFTGSPTISGQYTVAVSVNPATYVCNLTNGTGYGLANVTNVSIACSPPPLYSMTSFASGDALTTASITVRCTPGNSTTPGQDIDSPLAGVPQRQLFGATNVSATSFGVLGLGADGFSVANTGTASTSVRRWCSLGVHQRR